MNESRIADLLQPFLPAHTSLSSRATHAGERTDDEPPGLPSSLLQSISMYIDILLRWNARINLTAIRDAEQIITRHFGESFFAATRLFPDEPANDQRPATNDRPSVADVGSGAGFPGLPIKLWQPNISLTLIESNHKKAAFLKEIIRALTLTDVNVQTARAETLAGSAEDRYDVVILRAVERFETILPTAAALVAPAGRLALLIGSAQAPQARAALPAWRWLGPDAVPQSRTRVLLIAKRS